MKTVTRKRTWQLISFSRLSAPFVANLYLEGPGSPRHLGVQGKHRAVLIGTRSDPVVTVSPCWLQMLLVCSRLDEVVSRRGECSDRERLDDTGRVVVVFLHVRNLQPLHSFFLFEPRRMLASVLSQNVSIADPFIWLA